MKIKWEQVRECATVIQDYIHTHTHTSSPSLHTPVTHITSLWRVTNSLSLAVARKLKPDEKLLEAKSKWKNQNPTYFKFIVKIERGAPEAQQMRFRDKIYK